MKLFALSLLTMLGLMLAAPAYAAPVAPPECGALAITTTIVATSPVTTYLGTDVVVITGTSVGKNVISAPNAAGACIVAQGDANVVFASPGDDVVIARGNRNYVVGGLGSDTCYGTLGVANVLNCETRLP